MMMMMMMMEEMEERNGMALGGSSMIVDGDELADWSAVRQARDVVAENVPSVVLAEQLTELADLQEVLRLVRPSDLR